MDEETVREHARHHVRTLRAGDLPSAFADLTNEAKSQVEPYVLNFPSPVEKAEIVSIVPLREGYVVVLELSGGGRELRLETTWSELNGRPRIVEVRGAG